MTPNTYCTNTYNANFLLSFFTLHLSNTIAFKLSFLLHSFEIHAIIRAKIFCDYRKLTAVSYIIFCCSRYGGILKGQCHEIFHFSPVSVHQTTSPCDRQVQKRFQIFLNIRWVIHICNLLSCDEYTRESIRIPWIRQFKYEIHLS